MPKMSSFWKPEACGQTVLPDKSLSIRLKLMEKLVENGHLKKLKNETFCVIFKHCGQNRRRSNKVE